MASLTGKVAWVTGAGSGIGQAAAVALAKEGATVVLTGRRKEPLEATAATIKQAGGKAVVKPGDLMKASAVTRIAKDIDKKFGRCDILVNNAGLNILERKWSQLTPAGAEHGDRRQPVERLLLLDGGAADDAQAQGRRADPHLVDGRPAGQHLERARPIRRPSTAWWR